MRTEKYAVLGQLMQSRHTFVITGFIAEKDAPSLKTELEGSYGAFVELFAPGEKEDVPVRLQNGRFSSPVEPVLEGYALPARGEVDPCSVMAIFYYVLFGMMLSDACYGLIMVLGCGIVLHKFRYTMESGMKKIADHVFVQRDFHHVLGRDVRRVLWRRGHGDCADLFPFRFYLGTRMV